MLPLGHFFAHHLLEGVEHVYFGPMFESETETGHFLALLAARYLLLVRIVSAPINRELNQIFGHNVL